MKMYKGKILSNVSANRMHFAQNGQKRYYIQIGTVMTDKDHRKQDFTGKGFVKVDAKDASFKKKYCEAVRRNFANSAFEQENKYNLQMFYTSEIPFDYDKLVLGKRNCISLYIPMHSVFYLKSVW